MSFLALALIIAAATLPAGNVRTRVSVRAADELADRRLAYLADRSATMRQVLEALDKVPAISVRLRSNAILWREVSRMGNGRFWRAGSHVIVLLQFDSAAAKPMEQIEWVAHEMAHAVEVACLPGAIDLDGLAVQLLRRGRRAADAPTLGIETPFAKHAGREMFIEALRGRPAIGRLPGLAKRYGLGSPCTE